MRCLRLIAFAAVCIAAVAIGTDNVDAYYAPHIGRFINRDPIGYAGGDRNLYAYVGGRAVSAVDPMGLQAPSGPGLQHVCSRPSNKCRKRLDQLLGGDFGKLVDLAVQSGCLKSRKYVRCSNCREIAAYSHSSYLYSDSIEFCRGEWDNLSRTEQETVAFHEVYHALTICSSGSRSHALDNWENLINGVAGTPGWSKSKECAMCYAQELIAQHCAHIQIGKPAPLWGAYIGKISASCSKHCDINDFLKDDPIFKKLTIWFKTKVTTSCNNINRNAGL